MPEQSVVHPSDQKSRDYYLKSSGGFPARWYKKSLRCELISLTKSCITKLIGLFLPKGKCRDTDTGKTYITRSRNILWTWNWNRNAWEAWRQNYDHFDIFLTQYFGSTKLKSILIYISFYQTMQDGRLVSKNAIKLKNNEILYFKIWLSNSSQNLFYCLHIQ